MEWYISSISTYLVSSAGCGVKLRNAAVFWLRISKICFVQEPSLMVDHTHGVHMLVTCRMYLLREGVDS
jgi:hypothetical protein